MSFILRSCAARIQQLNVSRRIVNIRLLTSQVDTSEGNYEKKLYNQRIQNESMEQKKARLQYQSRKRGTLENDLLLSTFAHKYLPSMSGEELDQYDYLINTISNEWELYYWAVGVKETPHEYDNAVMRMFAQHVKNEKRETRFRQPNLIDK